MNREDTMNLARRCSLLDGISEQELADVVAACDEEVFAPGHRILTAGLDGQETFLILAGQAWVVNDVDLVTTLGPGEVFGEMAVLDGGPRGASVVARTQLRCLVLPNCLLRDLLLEHPRIGLNLLEVMSLRLRLSEQQRSRDPASVWHVIGA